MRADRLVAILLLLQRRGQVTAAEVADELEVSERTARRDLEALGMAGLPIYSRQGRHGGWQLAGGGRSDLSGLSAAEARALFLVAGPASTITPEVKTALRKLVRAIPEPFRTDAEAAATAVVVDPAGWDRPARTTPIPEHLEAVQRAVIEGEQISLDYVARDRARTSRLVHPLGLAAKGAVWYLVAGTDAGLRTFRVDRMVAVASTGQRVVRPEGFDLAEAWRLISTEVEERRAPFRATVLATPPAVAQCRWVLGTRVRIGPPSTDGRIELEIRGHSFRSLAGELAGFGPELEIVDPPEVREHLARIGSELTASYGTVAGSQTRAKWARSTRPERSRVAVSSAVGEVRSDAKVVRPTA
jgi:predicted DNA-binding transcriptional regulator YafY